MVVENALSAIYPCAFETLEPFQTRRLVGHVRAARREPRLVFRKRTLPRGGSHDAARTVPWTGRPRTGLRCKVRRVEPAFGFGRKVSHEAGAFLGLGSETASGAGAM